MTTEPTEPLVSSLAQFDPAALVSSLDLAPGESRQVWVSQDGSRLRVVHVIRGVAEDD